jgi:uncharacterized membrane protein (DUF485 family)
MKTNKLQVLYVVLCGVVSAFLFGNLLGGGDAQTTMVAGLVSFVSTVVLTYGYTPKDRKEMAFACGAITSGITLNCEDPLTSGVVATFYIANKDDIASITYDPSNPMVADSITMVATKTFFTFEGQLQSTEPKFAMIKGKYVNQFEHSVGALIFKIDPDTKKEILNMKDGNFVCIVQNNYTGATGNCKYELYGAGSGLKAEVLERNPNDTENLGAFKIELKTQEYAREGKPPVTFFDTDLATTETAIAGLL